MKTAEALSQLGVNDQTLCAQQYQDLQGKGYFIVKNYFSKADVAWMGAEFDRLQAIEGEQGGHEVHTEAGAPRLSNILNKSTAFDVCLECKPLLAAAFHVLGPEIKVHGFNIRDAAPGQGHQRLHSDGPKIEVGDYRVVNSLILIDPFEADNGATRIVPGTHQNGERPQDTLDDANGPLSRRNHRHRAGRRAGCAQCPHLAWGHMQCQWQTAAGTASLLHPAGPAPTACPAGVHHAGFVRAHERSTSLSAGHLIAVTSDHWLLVLG